MRGIKGLAIIFVLVGLMFGQGQYVVQSIQFRSQPPTGLASFSTVYTGAAGTNCQYYWLVTKFVGGSTFPTGPNTVCNTGTLGGGNTVLVTYGSVTGQTGVDILKTTTNQFPTTGSCTCSLATNQTSGTFTDNAGALSAYTLAGFANGNAVATMGINVRDYATPVIEVAGIPIRALSGLVTPPGGISQVANALVDANGNSLIIPGTTQTSPVNFFTATNGPAGTGPTLSASGSDAIVDNNLGCKGTGCAVILPNNTYSVEGNISDANLATGVAVVPAVVGHTLKVVGGTIQPIGGAVATCTDIRIQDTGSANDVLRFLVAGTLSQNVAYGEDNLATQVTVGAGTVFGNAFGAGLGIQIKSTGATCTGSTGIQFRVFYKVNF